MVAAGSAVPLRAAPGAGLLLGLCAVGCLAGCGGSGGQASAEAVGELVVSGCVIAEGASSCAASVSWSTTNAMAPRLVLGSTTLSSASVGSLRIDVGGAAQTVTCASGSACPVAASCTRTLTSTGPARSGVGVVKTVIW